ncbi:hypothetical protein N7G274_004819 [Stereocaulon virgatum]|uniref:Secreted protein n=1 Tax=Stereocaulon virgatum TaxID=373712 RepID=A0ABR4AB57_9LECA
MSLVLALLIDCMRWSSLSYMHISILSVSGRRKTQPDGKLSTFRCTQDIGVRPPERSLAEFSHPGVSCVNSQPIKICSTGYGAAAASCDDFTRAPGGIHGHRNLKFY